MAQTSVKHNKLKPGFYYRFLKCLVIERCKVSKFGCFQGFWSFTLSGFLKTALLIFGLSILYSFDPFGLSSSATYHSKSLFYQWSAASYKGGSENPASVVILRDESFKGSWPVSAIVHAEILEAILSYQPKAVFIDFAFIDERDDKTMQSEFIPFLESYIAETDSVNLYFLTIPPTEELPKGILAEIAGTGVKLVSGPAEDKQFPGLKYVAQTKPVQLANKLAPSVPAVAFAMYRDQFPEQLIAPDNMEIVWRLYSKTGNNGPYLCKQQCTSGFLRFMHRFLKYTPDFVGELFRQKFSCLSNMEIRQQCPPIQTLDAHFLLNGVSDEPSQSLIKQTIKGKYVFYGADLDAVNDHILPPTHNSIAGVYFHAMALDNLLTYGSQYIRDTKGEVSRFAQYLGLVILVLLSLGARKLLHGINRDCSGELNQKLMDQRSAFCCILLELAVIILYFLVSVLAIVSLVYITFYYLHISPIGFIGLIGLIGFSAIPSLVRSYDQLIKNLFSKIEK